jgi:hypothetical protein
VTILALCHCAGLPAYPDGRHVLITLRPGDKARYRSACDDSGVVLLIEFLCARFAIQWGKA